MAANPSFDVVSKVDQQEVDNAVRQTEKELCDAVRLPRHRGGDRLGRRARRRQPQAETEERVKAALDVFKEKLIKRNISLKSLDAGEPQASGKIYKIDCKIVQGIDSGEGQGDPQEDPRRGPEGRPGADPGRPAPGDRQEEGRPAGRHLAAQGRRLRRRPAVHQLPLDPRPAVGRARAGAPRIGFRRQRAAAAARVDGFQSSARSRRTAAASRPGRSNRPAARRPGRRPRPPAPANTNAHGTPARSISQPATAPPTALARPTETVTTQV